MLQIQRNSYVLAVKSLYNIVYNRYDSLDSFPNKRFVQNLIVRFLITRERGIFLILRKAWYAVYFV